MLQDLDATLKTLLDDAGAPQVVRDAEVSFKTPDKSFTPDKPTVDLFLYEVKENRELRDPEPLVERVGGTFVRRRPPLRVDCSYLVTAWVKDSGEDEIRKEHELLSSSLAWLSRFPTIPVPFLTDAMAGQPFPPPTLVAQTDGAQNSGEFWTALGIPPRSYFNLVVTIAVPLGVQVPEGPPVVTKDMRLLVKDEPTSEERWFQIGGTVRRAAAPKPPVPGATVVLVETGDTRTTDALGRFSFSPLAAGAFNLKVTAAGFAEKTRAVVVPGAAADAYDVELTP